MYVNMFSDEDCPFELEENELEFNEICSRLKNHPFPSPWEIFFKSARDDGFNTEVSEFVLEDDGMKEDSNMPDQLARDESSAIPLPHDVIKMDCDTSCNIPFDEKKVNRLKESLMNAEDSSTVDHIKDVDIFFMISSTQIPMLFKMLDVSVLSENAVTLLLNAFLHFKDKISIATATSLVSYIICPLIFKLKKTNSRYLLTTILKFSEAYPKAVVDEMIIPYMKDTTTDDLQSEIFFQISKIHLPNEYVPYCIKSILEHAPPAENTFAILQSLIERKCHHEKEMYDVLLKKLLSWTPICNKNVKFTKLLTSILSAYGSELTDQQILLCDEVIKSNKTIIKKAAENLLKKLKQGHE